MMCCAFKARLSKIWLYVYVSGIMEAGLDETREQLVCVQQV